MISKNTEDYVKVYKDFIDTDLCNTATAHLDELEWTTHKFYDPKSKKYFENEKELSVSFEDIPESLEIKKCFWNAIHKYVLEDFKDLTWWDGWEGFSHLKFNRYDPNTKMSNHCDHIKSIFDGNIRGVPILSVIALLNDDFTGGNFIMWNDTQINIEKGSIMIFPSNFMYPHMVTEVTKGVRYTCISWVW